MEKEAPVENKTIRDSDLSFQSFIRPLADLKSAATENTIGFIRAAQQG